jgi:hypothetical protein
MSDTTDSLEETAVTSPADTNTDATPEAASEATAPETVSFDLYKKLQAENKSLRTSRNELLNANKSETELLRERAMEAARLAPEVERLQAENAAYVSALAAEITAQKESLPKELSSLLPSKSSPVEQLEWLRKARKTAESLTAGGKGLPLSGGRNPSTTPQTETVEQIAQRMRAAGDIPRF